jgi:hypothetical protein
MTNLSYIVNDHRSRRVPKVDRGERTIPCWAGAKRSVAKRSVTSRSARDLTTISYDVIEEGGLTFLSRLRVHVM